ncbi:Y-box factor [Portunus trituberculatus]|uniref:Y-box factor n=1 Tax=Portunus trituberculatus TaxID=210409 RepID=A0A5B7GSI9_PORTR|nr:Y-box factor [Portunus trituberculatus]
MTSPAQHPGLVKWYNVKACYGFIQDLHMGADVFCHASDLNRPLRNNPPREGDQVLLAIQEGAKGPEARDVAPVGSTSDPSKSSHRTPRKQQEEEEDVQAKIYACIYTAKAIAGTNYRRLQEMIPFILQYNGLPAVYIPRSALPPTNRDNTRLSRRDSPGADHETGNTSVAAPNLHHIEHPTEKEAGTEQGRRDEAKDVDDKQEEGKDDEDDEENEEVDVERNTSEATKPANPSRAHESDAALSTSSDDDESDD